MNPATPPDAPLSAPPLETRTAGVIGLPFAPPALAPHPGSPGDAWRPLGGGSFDALPRCSCGRRVGHYGAEDCERTPAELAFAARAGR